MRIYKILITVLLSIGFFLIYPVSNALAATNLVITSTNMPPHKIILGTKHTIQLNFNYNIQVKSTSTIKLYQDNASIPLTYKVIGNKLYIYSTNPYQQNKAYKLYLRNIKETSSSHPFNPYTLNFRVTKYNPTVIGQTDLNRDVHAYIIGSGPKKIVLLGAMHGDEKNAYNLLNKVVSYLDHNSSRIPVDKQIIIIPVLNVDGFLANSRFNARHVDLNRNFDTEDWEHDSYIGSTKVNGGGGPHPNSESETQIMSNLMSDDRPYMTVTYHSAAAYVISNGKNLSGYRAKRYAEMTGYRYIPYESSATDGFNYKITGDFTVWANEETLNAFTVELRTKTDDDYSNQIGAIWYLINI